MKDHIFGCPAVPAVLLLFLAIWMSCCSLLFPAVPCCSLLFMLLATSFRMLNADSGKFNTHYGNNDFLFNFTAESAFNMFRNKRSPLNGMSVQHGAEYARCHYGHLWAKALKESFGGYRDDYLTSVYDDVMDDSSLDRVGSDWA